MNYGDGAVRRALRLAPDEQDQVLRLARFRARNPGVVVGEGEFGTWEGRIPEENGETTAVRYTLRELLDKLDELTGPEIQPA